MCIYVYTHGNKHSGLSLSPTLTHIHKHIHTSESARVSERERTSARTRRSWSVTRRVPHVQLGGGGDAIHKETAVLQQLACVDERARRRINLNRHKLVPQEMTERRRVQHQPHTHILRASNVSGADTTQNLSELLVRGAQWVGVQAVRGSASWGLGG